MKAVVRYRYGSPEQIRIENMPKPVPGPDQVLIRVRATTINRTDCGVLSGAPYIFRFFVGWPKPRTPILGTDFAGVVEEVGSKVSKFKVGDKVWGFDDNGLPSQAEYLAYGEDKNILGIPEGVSFKEAAACAEGAHYAVNFLKYVKLNPESNVLVNGATGGIGSALVQLLKYQGVKVTATANTKNMELIGSMGLDRVINYEKEDFTKLGETFEVIFDAVGKSTFGKCKAIMKENGFYLSSELGDGIENLYLPFFTKLKGGKRVLFPMPNNIKGSMNHIQKIILEGKFRPIIERSFSLEEAREAYGYVSSGRKTGNVVFEID
ncbi:NAD(P)-dependent alcohol dehydrogenase [Shivajiella indica]|uniref:NAD(P)-dependent alcohol dehydrogenase n=1 Tax=Shivajiella indica TaxID=872115 RepID=A0ABW5BC77_9BACT